MRERKAAERERARALRRAIPPERRAQMEAAIRGNVLALPEVEDAFLVGTYLSVGSEVGTRDLVSELLARGKRVALPVVLPEAGAMRFGELGAPDALVAGRLGIPEPAPPRTFVDDADVLLVPGLLFTRDGHRLGNGGGYFDRALRDMPHALRVGLAFHEQVVAELPMEAHDERLDVLVTDREVVRTLAR